MSYDLEPGDYVWNKCIYNKYTRAKGGELCIVVRKLFTRDNYIVQGCVKKIKDEYHPTYLRKIDNPIPYLMELEIKEDVTISESVK